MRILFCSPNRKFSRELGGSKVMIELAEEMKKLGCDYHLYAGEDGLKNESYAEALKKYVIANIDSYDIVEVPDEHFPFNRDQFSKKSLIIARSVLLGLHLENIKFNEAPITIKSKIKHLFIGNSIREKQKNEYSDRFADTRETLINADFINVANSHDQELLIASGHAEKKIIVQPYGINETLFRGFDALSTDIPKNHKIAFVGTFDYRKGCYDIVNYFTQLSSMISNLQLKLLGTKGMIQDETTVLNMFPKKLREKIFVLPRYSSDKLPELLKDCTMGIFPSYLEGFGMGVIEMLAAGLPVFAYDAPGPSDILPGNYLAPPGNVDLLVSKSNALLNDNNKLLQSRLWAKEHAKRYSWKIIANDTLSIYSSLLDNLSKR